MPLPTNRTTANSDVEHVDDHNILHDQHNTWEGETPAGVKDRGNHTGTQPISTLSDHNKTNHDNLLINADTVDGLQATAFSLAAHTHTEIDVTDLDHADADALHDNVPAEINAITTKGTPTSSDVLVLEDAADSFNKKKFLWSSLPGAASAGIFGGQRDSSFGNGWIAPWDFIVGSGSEDTIYYPVGFSADPVFLDLQAMLNSLSDGDTVLWPRGEYRVKQTLNHPILEGVAHRGEGGLQHLNGGGTILKADKVTAMTIIDYNNTGAISDAFAGPAFYNIKFDSVQGGKIHTGLRLFNVNRWRTIDCTFKDFSKGILVDRGTGGDDNAWWEVHRCNFYKNLRGMDIEDAFGGNVIGGVAINETGDTTFRCNSAGTVRFFGVKIDGGRGFDFFSDGWSVTACIFENCTTQGIRINNPGSAIRNGMSIVSCEFGTGTGWTAIQIANSANIEVVTIVAPIFEFGPTYLDDVGDKASVFGSHWRDVSESKMLMYSPDGTKYRLTIANGGALVTTSV